MNISDAGLDLIKQHEGLRLNAYSDAVGILTIGYGHTGGVALGDICTEEEAVEWLRADVVQAETCVNNKVRVGMTQGQFDALVSFVFNLGCGALASSTLLKKLTANDEQGAADEFLKWNHAGGKVLGGLTARREDERNLFLA